MSDLKELDAMKAIAESLETLDDNEQGRVLAWANSKYGVTTLNDSSAAPNDSNQPAAQPASEKKSKAKKSTRKQKSVLTQVKGLDFFPKDQESASEFVKNKNPTNVIKKCVVAAYYLKETLKLDKITVDHIYTFFKSVQWSVPSNLKNTLHQAGSENYLDTSDSVDIKLTTTGENLVEHQLPAK